MGRAIFPILFFAVLLLDHSSEAARILAVFPFPSPSHVLVESALTKALAARGHQLVVVSPYPLQKTVPNYTDVDISADIAHVFKEVGLKNMYVLGELPFHKFAPILWNMGLLVTESVLTSPKMNKILEDEQGFDLVLASMFLNEAVYGLAHKFKAPLILICPFGGFHFHNYGVANPAPTSYVPNSNTEFSSKMNFKERFVNTIFSMVWGAGNYFYYLPGQEAISKKVFGANSPSIHELDASPSLILVNQDFNLNYPRPLLPNIIEVGGMHVSRDTKPLQKEFQDFLDGAKEGAVYFSMGSNLKSTDLGPEKIKAFVDAFSELPQRVLWKWESDTLPGHPTNIKVSSWMPQQEILAHPNVKVFITHGGLLSAQEAAFHGKALIGIPIFGDQRLNIKRGQIGGYAVLLELKNITKESVLWAINEALHNPKIQEATKKRSLQYLDQPLSPLDKAIFWTEYVLRHNGAPHLKSAGADLRWFQLCLLDVYAAIFLPILLLLLICVRCCCSKRSSVSATVGAKKKKN